MSHTYTKFRNSFSPQAILNFLHFFGFKYKIRQYCVSKFSQGRRTKQISTLNFLVFYVLQCITSCRLLQTKKYKERSCICFSIKGINVSIEHLFSESFVCIFSIPHRRSESRDPPHPISHKNLLITLGLRPTPCSTVAIPL